MFEEYSAVVAELISVKFRIAHQYLSATCQPTIICVLTIVDVLLESSKQVKLLLLCHSSKLVINPIRQCQKLSYRD